MATRTGTSATAVMLAATLVGCGGVTGSTVQTSLLPTPARPQTRLQAAEGRACRRFDAQLAGAVSEMGRGDFPGGVRREERAISGFVVRLAHLRAPAPQAAAYRAFVIDNRIAQVVFSRVMGDILGHRQPPVALMEQGAVADSAARSVARRLSLAACATGRPNSG